MVNTLFCQHVTAYTGPYTVPRGPDVTAVQGLAEPQDLVRSACSHLA